MFAGRYFNERHFAQRYFPKVGASGGGGVVEQETIAIHMYIKQSVEKDLYLTRQRSIDLER